MSLIETLKTLANPRLKLDRLPSINGKPSGEEPGERPRARGRSELTNPPLILGGLVLLMLALLMLFGPQFMPHNPYITARSTVPHYDAETGRMIKPPFKPSAEFPLGSDAWGNDMLSLIVYGSRVTLIAAAYITLARLVLGALLGSLAGWYAGRWADRSIMLVSGVITSFPLLLSSMLLILALDIKKGLVVFLIALTAVGWTEIAEHVRSQVLVIREMAYIEGARAVGLNAIQTLVRHVLPNLIPHLIVISFLDMGAVLLLMAELGFLGIFIGGGSTFSLDSVFGTTSQIVEVPEWGALLAQGTSSLRPNPHLVMGPALAFFISILGLNSLGEGLRRLMNQFSLNTGLLLRRRTVIFAAALVAAMIVILQLTGPKVSYHQVARTFAGEKAEQYASRLQQASLQRDATANYISDQFEALGLQRGVRFSYESSYLETLETRRLSPVVPPRLALMDTRGKVLSELSLGQEFSYVLRGPAGAGDVIAPLSLVTVQPLPRSVVAFDLSRILRLVRQTQGRVVMIPEANLHNVLLEGLIRNGTAGLLLITADDQAPLDPPQVVTELALDYEPEEVPVFRIHPSTALAILSQAGLGEEALLPPEDVVIAEQRLDLQMEMSLDLQTEASQRFPVVMGFLPGYDGVIDRELVVVASSFQGEQPEGETASTATLLEIARSWKEARLDPRRSLVFIAWGSGDLTDPAFEEFITNPLNFTRLPINSNQIGEPRLVFALEAQPDPGEKTSIAAGADQKLETLLLRSARSSGLEIEKSTAASPSKSLDLGRLQSILINIPAEATLEAQPPAEGYHPLGEMLSYALIQVLRQEIY